jgi:hypothetical protein
MQLNTTLLNDYCKIYAADSEYTDVDALAAYVRVHRTELMQELHQYGILLFRGFKLQRHYEFHELIEHHFQLEPWHTFTPKKSGWFASFIRKYSENRAGDDRPYLNHNTVQLGSVENSIQGPHVEGGLYSTRSRYIALFCQEPADHLLETGFNNLEKIWAHFPVSVQQKYLGAWNHFSYISTRKLNLFDRLTFNKSSFSFQKKSKKESKLTLKRSPFVVIHPNTQKLMIQPWAFANNTNSFAHQAAQKSFKHRGKLLPDPTAHCMQLSWELFTHEGEKIEWTDQEKQHFFEALYHDALLLQWQKGDVALIDNIKIAHWRMNGKQGQRKLMQIQANVFNADQHAAL